MSHPYHDTPPYLYKGAEREGVEYLVARSQQHPTIRTRVFVENLGGSEVSAGPAQCFRRGPQLSKPVYMWCFRLGPCSFEKMFIRLRPQLRIHFREVSQAVRSRVSVIYPYCVFILKKIPRRLGLWLYVQPLTSSSFREFSEVVWVTVRARGKVGDLKPSRCIGEDMYPVPCRYPSRLRSCLFFFLP